MTQARASLVLDSETAGAVDGLEKTRKGVEDVEKAAEKATDAASGLSQELDGAAKQREFEKRARETRAQVDALFDGMRAAQDFADATDTAEASVVDAATSAEKFAEEIVNATDSAREAEQALVDMGEASNEATDSGSGGLTDFKRGLGAAAIGATVLVGGVALLKSAFRNLAGSAKAFFETAEGGSEQWDRIEAAATELKGLFFELAIGTDDAAAAGEFLVNALEDVAAIGRGVMSVVQPLTSALANGLAGALDLVAGLFGDVREEAAELAGDIDYVGDALERLEDRTSSYEQQVAASLRVQEDEEALFSLLVDVAEQAADELERVTEVERRRIEETNGAISVLNELTGNTEIATLASGDFREAVIDGILALDDMGASAFGAEGRVLAFGGGAEAAAVGVENLAEALKDVDVEVAGGLFGALDIITAIRGELDALGAEEDERKKRRSSEGRDESAIEAQRVRIALLQKQKEETEALAAARALAVDESRSALELALTEAQTEATRNLALMEETRAANAIALEDEVLAKKQASADQEAALAAQAQQRNQLAMQAAMGLTNAFTSMASGIAQGHNDSGEAVRGFFGDVITVAGQVALAMAQMRWFQPELGGPASAIGLMVAGSAAVALGQALGSNRGSGGGAGRNEAPVATAATQTTTNTSLTLVNNFQGFTSYEDYLQVEASSFDDMQERGYLSQFAA